jgi:hypothetical protein
MEGDPEDPISRRRNDFNHETAGFNWSDHPMVTLIASMTKWFGSLILIDENVVILSCMGFSELSCGVVATQVSDGFPFSRDYFGQQARGKSSWKHFGNNR